MVKNEYYPDGGLKSTYIVDPDNSLPPEGMSAGLREQLRHPLMKATAGSKGGSNMSKGEIERQLTADVAAYARQRGGELADAAEEFGRFVDDILGTSGAAEPPEPPPDLTGIDPELTDLLDR